jgi:hypothetical protein
MCVLVEQKSPDLQLLPFGGKLKSRQASEEGDFLLHPSAAKGSQPSVIAFAGDSDERISLPPLAASDGRV